MQMLHVHFWTILIYYISLIIMYTNFALDEGINLLMVETMKEYSRNQL
jgi:hypothetical protein